MPAIQANARNFKLNTDYQMDKVILMQSGTFQSNSSGVTNLFPHGLTFAPLIVVQWSPVATFAESYETTNALFRTSPYEIYVLGQSTTSNTSVFAFSNTPQTLYYRAYGLLPSDVAPDVPYTSTAADTFTFNTDAVTSKLLIQGVTPTSTSQQIISVPHGLGYKPQVLGWEEESGVVTPINFVSGTVDYAGIEVTTDSIIVRTASNSASSNPRCVHYRVYADD